MKTFSSLYFWSANTDKLLKKVRPGNSLISYACDVTWLTHQAQGKVQLIHFTMKKRGGKTCAAGAPGGISCTNNSYTPNVSMHTFPKNEKVRDQWVKFVNVHRPDWKPTSSSALCSVHFHESCFTRLKLSRLLPANTSDENSISSEESSSTKPKEKRVLVTGSVPTIQCAIQAPVIEQSPRERRRLQAVSVKCMLSLFLIIFIS